MKDRKLNTAGKLFFILYILAALFMCAIVAILNVLPGKYICALAAGIAVVTIILGILLLRRKNKKGVKIFGIVLSVILIAGYCIAGVYMHKAGTFVEEISDNGKDLVEYYVVGKADTEKASLADINGDKVYITSDIDEEYMEAQDQLVEDAAAAESEFKYKYCPDMDVLFTDVVDGTADEIFLAKTSYDMYEEQYSDMVEQTKVICSVFIEKESNSEAKTVDVTKEPFNLYITGLDTTGTIDVQSLSDVNMIVTVNPETKKILLTSIPRDYYVLLHDEQSWDKLTHTGSKGASATVSTVEDLMGCDINYYFKCNFSTVVALIDAIGGITVNSDYTFTTHGRQNEGYYFVQGENTLNGAQALAFARERKSFSDGDNQRIKDQQIVLEATLKKVTSSKTLLTSYSDILSGISDYIETNMSDEEMKALVKMQLDDMAEWEIKKVSLTGEGSSQPCYLAGNAYASVILQDQESIDKAKAKMAKVFAGN